MQRLREVIRQCRIEIEATECVCVCGGGELSPSSRGSPEALREKLVLYKP